MLQKIRASFVFTTFTALPESLGVETLTLRREDRFLIDVHEIEKLADNSYEAYFSSTAPLIIQRGTTISDEDFERRHDFAVRAESNG
jgi:hypothetical protein